MIDGITIDPGEILLARTGISHVLSNSDKSLWLRKTADPIEGEIESKMKAFLGSEREAVKITLPAFNYETVLDQLTKIKEPNHKAFEKLDSSTITGYLASVSRAVKYLASVIPKSAVKDMIGVRNLLPPELKISKFRRIYAVAEDPMSALKALVDGTLVKDQTLALQVMFPGIFSAAKAALMDAIVDKRAADMKWTLPYAKDQLLQVFLLATPDNQDAMKKLQQNYADAKARQGQKSDDTAQSKPAPGAKLAQAFQTPIQRAATS